jgi:hypothetical protein
MFIQSNDLFHAPGPDGVDPFEDGQPVSGDVTDQVALWDASTEGVIAVTLDPIPVTGRRRVDVTRVGSGETVTVTLTGLFADDQDRTFVGDAFEGPVEESEIRSITVDGDTADPGFQSAGQEVVQAAVRESTAEGACSRPTN